MDLKYKSKTYIEQGLTNNNYLLELMDNQKVVYRHPKDHHLNFNYLNEETVINLIKPLEIGPHEIYFNSQTGEKVSSYIDNARYFNNKSHQDIRLIATSLRKLHTLSVTFSFDMFKKLNEYKGTRKSIYNFEENIITILKEYQANDDMVLCHNDLVKGNLLFTDRFYLIDYEYASNNYVEFDLASLLSENNIESLKTIKIFLNEYYQKEVDEQTIKKVMTYYIFEDILWSYWALHFFSLTNELIYHKIYKQKHDRAIRLYHLYIKKGE